MFEETVTLILKHSDISANVNDVTAYSDNGEWSNGKQITKFRLNLKKLLGDVMYQKYDTYVLRLNQMSNASANFPITVNTDQQVIIQLSGLTFLNSTYSQKIGNNTGKYPMVLANLPVNTAVTINYSPNISMCNFRRTSENVELTIELIRMLDGLPAQYGATDKFPHMTYSFDIYPINNI